MKIKNARRSIRIPGFDYSQLGMYFITICTHESQYLFGEIMDGKMYMKDLGCIVEYARYKIPECFQGACIDDFVVMPNHVHGIIHIVNENEKPISSMVRYFKTIVTRWAKANTNISPVWQRNYYEHIVRDEEDYGVIADYIKTNPIRWSKDDMYKG